MQDPGAETNGQPALARAGLQPADAVILAALGLFSALAVVCRPAVPGWHLLLAKNLCVALVVLVSAAAVARIRRPVPRFLLRTATITLCYAYLFGAVARLQMIVQGRWMDDRVLAFEQHLFGVQPTVWLERFVTPWLTEWMMFCYVVYLPLYPILCAIIYFKRSPAAAEEYFFALGLTNVLCDVGFILFPVAGPMYWMADGYRVPLHGYAFTWAGEFIRMHLHYAGGSIPSPHAAAATIMWLMAWKHHRPTFYAIAPIILTLYVSTFYGRYHYATDAVVGIVAAAAAALAAPVLLRAFAAGQRALAGVDLG